MILYHGSDVSIPVIDLIKSRPFKDFGKGFYLSDDYEQALALANSRVLKGIAFGVVNKYEIEDDFLESQDLKVKIFDGYSIEWAEYVLANRGGTSQEKYDIVYGPIADDKVGVQIQLVSQGFIDMKEFLNRLKYRKGITYQYFFGTEQAIKKLHYISE